MIGIAQFAVRQDRSFCGSAHGNSDRIIPDPNQLWAAERQMNVKLGGILLLGFLTQDFSGRPGGFPGKISRKGFPSRSR